jgi:C-1 hydroxylase
MSVEENKAVVRRLLEAINQQDLATVDEVAAPEVARVTKEDTIPFVYGTFGPQHHIEIADMIGEGDQVWARLATRGGHVAEWMGIAPTGTAWTNTVIAFARVADGKVVEADNLADIWNHVTQLGATLAPPQVAATAG